MNIRLVVGSRAVRQVSGPALTPSRPGSDGSGSKGFMLPDHMALLFPMLSALMKGR